MKTFQEFCTEAYQLNEFDAGNWWTRNVTNNPVVRRVTNNPVTRTASRVINNPVVRTGGRVVGGALNVGFNRALGLEKLTTDDPNVGPMERGLGAVSLVSPPGMSQVTGLGHNLIGRTPQLKAADKALAKSHERALRSNPQGYLQNLGMSF